jgi:hypothetical protein
LPLAATGSATPVRAAEEVAQGADEDRQILVMLDMPAPHYRPYSGYGGSYGDLTSRTARERRARNIAERYGRHATARVLPSELDRGRALC